MSDCINPLFTRHQALYEEIARSHPSLMNCVVICARCGRRRKVDAAACLRDGWPKCHETTMSLRQGDNS